MSPLINILVRTSNRPKEFVKCINSIKQQTYKNWQVWICYDKPESKKYIMNHTADNRFNVFDVESDGQPYHWNLYCNRLKEKVYDGWFFFLDDDDWLSKSTSLAAISSYLNNPEEALIFQFFRGRRPKPLDPPVRTTDNGDMYLTEVIRGKIGGSCIVLHHSKKHLADWDGERAADYRFIKAISQTMPLRFVPIPFVQAGNNGRHGS